MRLYNEFPVAPVGRLDRCLAAAVMIQ